MQNNLRLALTCTALVISGAFSALHGAGAQEPTPTPVAETSPAPAVDPTPEPVREPELSPKPVPKPKGEPKPKRTPKPAAASSVDLAVRATSGTGMYVWRWHRAGPVDAVVARAKESGINFLVVRASSQSEGFYLGPILTELLPKAHAAGIKVVAYDPPRFEDVEADARRAHELASFRVGEHGIDAFAADIEPRWDLLTPENAERYGARVRELVGPGYPLVAVVYPPNQVGARFPFAAVAKHFDVLSPMSYWRAKTLDGPGFVAASVDQLEVYGKPVTVAGQAFSYDGHRQVELRGHPPRAEFEATIAAARNAGAVGMSWWVWESAEPWVFDAIRAAAWPPVGAPAAAAPPAPRPQPPAPPAAPPAAAPAVPPVTPVATPEAEQPVRQALAATAAAPLDAARPWGVAAVAMLMLVAAMATAMQEHPVDARRVPSRLRALPPVLLAAVEKGSGPLASFRSKASRSDRG